MKVAGMRIDLPSNWQCSKCNDVIDVRDGTHDTPKYTRFGYPLITSKNLKPDGIDFSDVSYISEEDHRDISKRSKVDRNDILFAMIGTIGNPVIVETDEEFSVKNVALFKFAKSYIDPVFFKYLLGTPIIQRQLINETRGGTQKFVSLTVLRNMLIPYPPPEEQKRIAVILDKADRVRRKRQEAIRLTEELGRSIFLDMFGDPVTNPKGWKIAKIETIAAKEKNSMAIGPFGSNLKVSDYHESGYPIIFVKDVKENNFKWLSNRYVNDKKFKELSSHQVKPLDVLATKMGTPPCISAVYPKSMPTGVITADLIKISVSTSEAIPSYISIAINSDFCKQQVERITEGITRPKVTLRDFKKILIPIPPLGKQKKWEYKYEQLNLIKQKNRDQLLQLDELFNSLLQRAFRGEL